MNEARLVKRIYTMKEDWGREKGISKGKQDDVEGMSNRRDLSFQEIERRVHMISRKVSVWRCGEGGRYHVVNAPITRA